LYVYDFMSEPSPYERLHWRLFNASARFIGGVFALICSLFSALIVARYLGVIDGPTYPPVVLLFLVPTGVFGALMVKAKPYYPQRY
jgi:hypothetical protein